MTESNVIMANIDTNDNNIILNINSLKALVQPHLANCGICKKSQLVLEVVNISSICQKLRLTCSLCSIHNLSAYNNIKYLTNILPQTKNADRKKLKRQLIKKTLKRDNIIKPTLLRRDSYVGLTSYSQEKCSLNTSIQYDLSVRLSLSPFLNCVGFKKVAGILASLSINGATGIKHTFYDNQATLTRDIIRITEAVIKDA